MSQNDFNLANQGFPQMRSDMNSAFQALASNSSGATAPGTTYAYQFWYDTSTNLLKMRNADNNAWITLAAFDQSADEWQIRSSVIQAADAAGVEIKTDEGTTRITVADDGTVTVANDLEVTGSVSGSNIPGAGSFSNRNKIINGNFDIWQRGTSVTGSGYLADRWVHNVAAGSSGTVTQSRQAFSPGQTDVPNEPTYFYRIKGSSYTFTAGNVTQKIEDVRTFAGQAVTLSFYAKASAARNIRPRLRQDFDGSANVDTLASAVSLTTSWQKFTRTVTIPSISGKTIGASSRLELVFDIKEGAVGSNLNSDSIDIAQVQLEAGDVATPFEMRSYGQELALCQRYYIKTQPQSSLKRVYNSMGTILAMNVSADFPVTMRAAPSMTVYGDISDGSEITLGSAGAGATTNSFTAFQNISYGQFLDFHYYIADAEL